MVKVFNVEGAKGGKKVAVRSLSLAVPRGECFGLLGENGAGKTTTVRMLTGVFPPTDGEAFVSGYNCETEIDKVQLSIGVCPQHDVLWENMTVEEHLYFYARVKGVAPKYVFFSIFILYLARMQAHATHTTAMSSAEFV